MIRPKTEAPVNPFVAATEKFTALCTCLQMGQALAMSHSDVEKLIFDEGRALLRQMFQDHCDLRACYEKSVPLAAVVGDDGVFRNQRREDTERKLRSRLGCVTVTRIGYSQRGQTSRFPMDAALNLPHGSFSLGVRYLVAQTVASSAFDEVTQILKTHDGLTVGKRQVEQLTQAAGVDFDTFYAQRVAPPGTPLSSLLILSVDGKGVVMRQQDLRPATRNTAQTSVHKLRTRQIGRAHV